MLERWLYAERAHRLLKANGLNATLSKLRVPAPAHTTIAVPAPAQRGLLGPCGHTGAPMQCAGASAPVVATTPFKPPVAAPAPPQQPKRLRDNPARSLSRKRARRVQRAASGQRLRAGNKLEDWEADDPAYDYRAAIAKAKAAPGPNSVLL